MPSVLTRTRDVDVADIAVPFGHVRTRAIGPRDGALVACVPGVAANARWFDFLAERLAADGRRVVALDLRGRGYSAVSPPGSFGWHNHARDVYAVVRALGAPSFDYIGHSMGAYVGMEAGAMRDDARIRRLVLIDGLGVPRLAAVAAIVRNLERLGRTYDSEASYLAHIRGVGLVERWDAYWERAFAYDLEDAGGRVRSRTQRGPVFEDIAYGRRHDARRLWAALPMPALALRAARPIAGRTGFIVPHCDLANFARIAPHATVAEIDANHYDIVMHDHTLSTIRRFLDAA